ncbi:MAG: hypothetical protein ACU0DI_08850, partial [Paracoccaceae bacterium]
QCLKGASVGMSWRPSPRFFRLIRGIAVSGKTAGAHFNYLRQGLGFSAKNHIIRPPAGTFLARKKGHNFGFISPHRGLIWGHGIGDENSPSQGAARVAG